MTEPTPPTPATPTPAPTPAQWPAPPPAAGYPPAAGQYLPSAPQPPFAPHPQAAPSPRGNGSTRWLVPVVVGIVALGAGIGIGVAIKSSAKSTTVVTVTAGATGPGHSATSSPGSSSASTSGANAAKAHVGSTITLQGEQAGDALDVTLVQVAPTATATSSFDKPDDGNRYFAAQFRLVNSGKTAFSDPVSLDAVALDAQGQQYQPGFVEGITQGPLFADPVRIASGGTALGWIVFELPAATTITTMQFSLELSLGDTGQWIVP